MGWRAIFDNETDWEIAHAFESDDKPNASERSLPEPPTRTVQAQPVGALALRTWSWVDVLCIVGSVCSIVSLGLTVIQILIEGSIW